ncbi:uncharacterized protein [Danio rerio]|uniref:Uncharacterized protein n=1 Tax=Danio rerio TaxID=7955 RepID=A0AC58I6A0_DANRE
MDIIEKENVDISKTVIVGGMTLTETDSDLESWLLRYGSINRHLLIDDPDCEFHRHAIIEFTHNSAMKTLMPLLPLTVVSMSNPSTTFMVRALSCVYPHIASDSATNGYLEELQNIASFSGKSIEEVLQTELLKIKFGPSHAESLPVLDKKLEFPNAARSQILDRSTVSSPNRLLSPVISQSMITEQTAFPTSRISPFHEVESTNSKNLSKESLNHRSTKPTVTVSSHPALTMDIIDPPSVQKVVVEHIVRTNDTAPMHHTSFRLRSFSGKIPRPVNEPDFDTWRASVDLLLTDPSISDLNRARRIIDSLLPPAADIVKHVPPNSLPAVYLELLESVYGSVEDGDELLARFMNSFQNNGEKPSTYLHRLQVLLSTAIRRGGIFEEERNRYLLKQFCRGCWDSSLIAELQLERRKATPPSFAELVVLIRTEEDKNASKEERMRKHLGLNKHYPAPSKFRLSAHQISAHQSETQDDQTDTSLAKQVCELQAQVVALQKPSSQKEKKKNAKPDEVSELRNVVTELQAQITAMQTTATPKIKSDVEATEIADLKKQIADLKVQLTAPDMYRNRTRNLLPEPRATDCYRASKLPESRPRPGYCFRCAKDGHLASSCSNAPDPTKVAEKKRKLRERQAQWDTQQVAIMNPLN